MSSQTEIRIDDTLSDGEKPCCSKSLCEEAVQVAPVETESKESLAISTPPFSDTVLCIIPKLPEINEETEIFRNNQGCNNDKVPDPQVPQITRKPPNVSLFIEQSNAQFMLSSPSESDLKASEIDLKNLELGDNLIYDCNGNPIDRLSHSEKKLLDTASYLFHKDRRALLTNTLGLLPRGREFIVFNVFGDVARFFGFRGKRKRVKFPEEVIQQYEEKGDVAGKDRFVPTKKEPYKGVTPSTKKRKLSAVYSSWSVKEADFVPRVDRIDDYNRLEYFCEKHCIFCDCFTGSKKPDLTNVMEGFLSDLNVASLFIQGHASRTYDSALNTLEFMKLKRFGSTGELLSGLQRNAAKDKLGILSTNIWIMGYCLRTILELAMEPSVDQATSLPSENGFRKILEQFASLCLATMENVKTVLQYSHNFYNFTKECFRILKVLQIHVGFRAELRLRRPLKRGAGLELNKSLSKREIAEMKAINVLVAKSTSSNEDEELVDDIEWTSYEELSGYDKMSSLRHLLNVTSEGMTLVQTQLRFLMDDIVDSVRDVTEADLLFILADMHDRIKFLENVGSKHIKTEMEQICRLMTDFSKDFQAFVDLGQVIMKRFVEVRDVIHITHEFLIKGLRLESLNEMLPTTAFKKKFTLFGFCGGGVRSRKRIVEKHQPKYQPLDFFRVNYMEVISKNSRVQANRFYFTLAWSEKQIGSIYPLSSAYNWGETDTSSKTSLLDEYVDLDAEEEPNVVDIKPILLTPPSDET